MCSSTVKEPVSSHIRLYPLHSITQSTLLNCGWSSRIQILLYQRQTLFMAFLEGVEYNYSFHRGCMQSPSIGSCMQTPFHRMWHLTPYKLLSTGSLHTTPMKAPFRRGLCTTSVQTLLGGLHATPLQRAFHATPIQALFHRGLHTSPCKPPPKGDCIQPL